jgi:hypothetical protein
MVDLKGDTLSKVMAMRLANFRHKAEFGDHGSAEHSGFIVVEALHQVPDDVNYGPDGQPSGFNYPECTAHLMKAMQQIQREMAEQQHDIKDVKAAMRTITRATGRLGDYFLPAPRACLTA